ncbi:MAG: cold-shock protein [Candidatus Zixiibacteriota bacterium]
MPVGRVKRFDEKKGYGFIVSDEHSQDIFVHYSDIVDEDGFKTLTPGEEVEFEVSEGDKGLKAINVKKV